LLKQGTSLVRCAQIVIKLQNFSPRLCRIVGPSASRAALGHSASVAAISKQASVAVLSEIAPTHHQGMAAGQGIVALRKAWFSAQLVVELPA